MIAPAPDHAQRIRGRLAGDRHGGTQLTPANVAEAYSSVLGQRDGAAVYGALQSWAGYLGNPDDDWSWNAQTLAARSWDLIENDGHAAAMAAAVLLGTYGACGLRPRSLYQADDAAPVTEVERATRRQINASWRRASARKRLHAGGQFTRRQLGAQLLLHKIASGDGFAVRVWSPERPDAYQAQAWRIVPSERVSNPDNTRNTDTRWEGMEFDASGCWVGIWVRDRHPMDMRGGKATWSYVPTFSPDGSRNVIHTFRSQRGERRGLSWFTPLLLLAKHLQQIAAAFVVSKRIQACHPLVVRTNSPAELAAAERAKAKLGANTQMSPGRVLYTALDNEIYVPPWAFNGADYRDFIDSQLRVFTATWGLPFQFILQQLTDANLAAARAALDQAERAFELFQTDQQEDVESVFDEQILREEVLRGRLRLPGDDWSSIARATYLGPRRWSTDKVKDAAAGEAWIAMGMSPSTVFADQGVDYEEEVEQAAQDARYRETVNPKPAAPAPGEAQGPGSAPAPQAEDDEDDDAEDDEDETAAEPATANGGQSDA